VFASAESATNLRVPQNPNFPLGFGDPTTSCGFLRRNKTFPLLTTAGCPILCVLGKGWDTRLLVSRFVVSHPSQKARRMGHPEICCSAQDFHVGPFHAPAGRRSRWMTLMKAAHSVLGGAAYRKFGPLRSWQRVGYAAVGSRFVVSDPSQKSAKDGAPGNMLPCARLPWWPRFMPRGRVRTQTLVLVEPELLLQWPGTGELSWTSVMGGQGSSVAGIQSRWKTKSPLSPRSSNV
jgi:hypothetical protein